MDIFVLLTGIGILGIACEIAIVYRIFRSMEKRFTRDSKQYRRTKISGTIFIISSVILLVSSLYYIGVTRLQSVPGLGTGILDREPLFPLIWSMIAPLTACLTALGSFISMVVGVTVAIRKDSREKRLAEVELELRRLELEKERLAMMKVNERVGKPVERDR